MGDQLSTPMTVNEVHVTGAKNIRRGFLDPIIAPIVANGPNSPANIGDVLSKLQEASNKLSALR